MTGLTPLTCKYCGELIPSEKNFHTYAICPHCNMVNEIEDPKLKRRRRNQKILFTGISSILIFAFIWYFFQEGIMMNFAPRIYLKKLSRAHLTRLMDENLESNDHEKLVEIFHALSDKYPDEARYKANWAIQLTRLDRHSEALPIYQSLLNNGWGTYDFMYFYSKTLKGLGQIPDAIKWLEKSIEVHPSFINSVQDLASLYVQSKRAVEAVSLLQSFSKQFPKSSGYVAGDLSADLELVSSQEPQDTLRLISLFEGEFHIPVGLRKDRQPLVFLVDTGASMTTLSTADLEKNWPELVSKNRSSKGILADGSVVQMGSAVLPFIIIGKWKFQNIQIFYCDTCARLAGMNVLKKFNMKTESKGHLSTLTLSR